jgi:hypothetical protein
MVAPTYHEGADNAWDIIIQSLNQPRDFLMKGKQMYGERVVPALEPLAKGGEGFLKYMYKFANSLMQLWVIS